MADDKPIKKDIEMKEAQESKIKNIIDMALTFSATMRIFKKGSKKLIAEKIYEIVKNLKASSDYEKIHNKFCQWLVNNIPSSRNGNPSYGQAAKVLDVSMKVIVYYCNLPDEKTANALKSKLHCAIDKPLLKHLKSINQGIRANFISQVDSKTYKILQEAVKKDIKSRCSGLAPFEYDDIMWRKLNR